MAKKLVKQVKLQIEAAKATPAPPVGPALVKQALTSLLSQKNSTNVLLNKLA